MICSSRCVRPRPGSKMQHCGVCHRTFSGSLAGDMHRAPIAARRDSRGRMIPLDHRRRCMTEEEMKALGMYMDSRLKVWRSSLGDSPWGSED